MGIKKSPRPSDKTNSWKEMYLNYYSRWLFLGVKICEFNFFTINIATKIMIGPTIASGVILNPNILREEIVLTFYLLRYLILISTHLKLCLATTSHNFRFVKITLICLIWVHTIGTLDVSSGAWASRLLGDGMFIKAEGNSQNKLCRPTIKMLSDYFINHWIPMTYWYAYVALYLNDADISLLNVSYAKIGYTYFFRGCKLIPYYFPLLLNVIFIKMAIYLYGYFVKCRQSQYQIRSFLHSICYAIIIRILLF